MEKDQIITLEIMDMTDDGRGIGRHEGMAGFVSGAVFGDVVRAKVTKVKKRHFEAICEEFVKFSESRLTMANNVEILPICPYLEECGGCAYGMLDFETECTLKVKHIHDKLTRIGGVEEPKINPMIGGPESPSEDSIHKDLSKGLKLNYRNKAVMAVGLDNSGIPVIGFRGRKSHKIIDCDNCLIQAEPTMVIARVIRGFLKENKEDFLVVNRQTGQESLIFNKITVRTSFVTGEIMVIFDLSGISVNQYEKSMLDLIYSIDEEIEETFGEEYSLESVYARDKKTLLLAGKRTIKDHICGLDFEISPDSFYQVNPYLVEPLYEEALRYAGPGNILDLYCGVGTMGLIAAHRGANKVLGVESVRAAVLDANRNAVINGIVNATFICGEAERVFSEEEINTTKKEAHFNDTHNDGKTPNMKGFDAVIVDPPRKGCDRALLDTLVANAPKRIVYVSCDPGTLARDVGILREGGYAFIECTPVNQFPRTGHIEAVTLLEKKL